MQISPNLQLGFTDYLIVEDHTPEIYSIFVSWLEFGNLHHASYIPNLRYMGLEEEKVASRTYLPLLFRSYILGDALLAEDFQNYIINCLIARSGLCLHYLKTGIGLDHININYVMVNTCSGPPLCHMVYDYWIAAASEENPVNQRIGEEFYQKVTMRLINTARSGKALQGPWAKPSCVYHTHIVQPVSESTAIRKPTTTAKYIGYYEHESELTSKAEDERPLLLW